MINRNFTLIWSSQAMSEIATEMTSLALPLAVLAATGSPLEAGLVATAVGIAQLAAKLPGGLVADMVDRKRLMLLCDAGRAVLALVLVVALLTSRFSTVVAVSAAALSAVLSTFFSPAMGGLLREVVPPEQRREAITRTIVRTNVAVAVGPPLGGLLLGLGAPLAFAAEALTYVLSFLLLARVTAERRRPVTRVSAAQPRQLGSELTLGVRWVLRRRPLLALIGIVAYLNLLGRAVELLAAVDSSDLGQDPLSAGVVLTSAGCGGILGGMCSGWVLRRIRPSLVLVGITVSWLLLIPLTATGSSLITIGAIFLLVFGLPLVGALTSLTIMAQAPTRLQGRVSTAVTLMATSIAWLGPGLTGYLMAAYSARTASLLLTAPLLAILALLLILRRLTAALDTLGAGDQDGGDGDDGRPGGEDGTGGGGKGIGGPEDDHPGPVRARPVSS